MYHFLNEEHIINYEIVEKLYPPTSNQAKVLDIVFAIPGIFRMFKPFLEDGLNPVDLAVAYLDDDDDDDDDDDKEIGKIRLAKGEIHMIQLGMELYNGVKYFKLGSFDLCAALDDWDDDYVRLFIELIKVVRPSIQ